MNPLLLKFLKHFGFVVAGAAVAAIIAFVNGDPTFLAYLGAHPALSGVVPFVAGLLGAVAKFIADQDASN